jgi:hypothetical protein
MFIITVKKIAGGMGMAATRVDYARVACDVFDPCDRPTSAAKALGPSRDDRWRMDHFGPGADHAANPQYDVRVSK